MTVRQTNAGAFWYAGLPRYLESMEAWFTGRQRWAYDHAVMPDGTWRLCLGTLAFGAYVDRFLTYSLPSLLAPGNLGALNNPLWVFHTDGANRAKVEGALAPLRASAEIEIEVVPQDILDMVPEHVANKYWLLSCANNMHMQRAKYRACGYHLLMPDCIYAAGYFANLQRLAGEGRRAIVQTAISADLTKIGPVLARAGGNLLPAELTAAGLEGLHDQCRDMLMNGKSDYPSGFYLLMVGADHLKIMSPHMSLVYFSHDVLMRAPLRMFNTVDTQLPFFIPEDVEPYVPTLADGMAFIEVSPPEKFYTPSQPVSLVELVARFWILNCCTRSYERYLGLITHMPLPSGFVTPIAPMSLDEMAEMQRTVRKAVADTYETVRDNVPEELRTDLLTRLENERRVLA